MNLFRLGLPMYDQNYGTNFDDEKPEMNLTPLCQIKPKVKVPGLLLLLLPTLIPMSGVGTTCFHLVVIKIRHLFLRPA
jgi:hypothetical protein